MSDKAKILVVEDDMAVAMMMTYLLSQAGCEVETTLTGRKGMELATTRRFDLIILDVDLDVPQLSGFDICQELKQRHISYRTPILFISGNATEERRSRAFEIGAADFIEKPFGRENFVSRILSLVNENTMA